MDRKDYWNKQYVEYWKAVTNEAESKESQISSVKKLSGIDFKTTGIEPVISFLDKIEYSVEDNLLDYGCGFGRFYPYFSKKCNYFGIDISQAMIDECIKTYPNATDKFIVSEGEFLPFENSFFDKIVCIGVFDACYQEQALEEMLRVCKVGGFILLTGKNDTYFPDDEEAYVAEENARKKEHPNYFTNVSNMFSQIEDYCDIIEERYELRRGDFGKDAFVNKMPDVFYEWEIIIQKRKNLHASFSSFSDLYSKTWKSKNSIL